MENVAAMALYNVEHDFDVEVGEVGVTLRRGDKWFKVPAGTQLLLIRRDGSGDSAQEGVQGTGEVVGHWYGRLMDLPARVIEKEHEPSSRLYTGLLASLRRAYGEIAEQEMFTALVYRRLTVGDPAPAEQEKC